jgi:outer membrane protein OmpA-like peptidoglycan-associated protein
MYFALKPSAGSLVIDTSFGSNGFLSTVDPATSCGYNMPAFSVNTALTSNTSTALFAPLMLATFPRQTTVPNSPSFNGVTSYSGCYQSGPSQNMVTKIISIQANGTIKNTVDLPTGFDYFVNRWVIDPQGRWNASVRPTPMGGQQSPTPPSVEFIRLLPDGSFDTSFGTNGIKAMPSLPRAVTVNGTSVNMNYSISGFATTATGILFTGFAIAFSGNSSCGSPPYANSTMTYYPYYVSSDSGLLTSYGNNGLGDPISIEVLGADRCSPGGAVRTSYINSSGAHALFAQTRAIGAQSAGLMMATWNAATGVTGGGEGGGAVGTMSRTDNKVYSRKLPTRTQEGTALKVLTKKASRTQMLRSTTPKICVTLTESVVLVDEGRCNVQIVNKSDRRVVRSLSTRVRSTDVEVGTTVEVEDAIPFARVSTRLSKSAREQVVELAESAATAKRIILVGHTALLTEATASNNFISLQRAAAVKSALQAEFKKAGVNIPISIAALGSRAPLTTRSSEAAQSRNRRVDIYVMP